MNSVKTNPMTTPTHSTPHPLAVEAANQIWRELGVSFKEADASSRIIHTTALEPVIRAGEELARGLESSIARRYLEWPEWVNTPAGKADLAALAQWSTLTTPPESNLRPLEGSGNDFNEKSGSDERRANPWRPIQDAPKDGTPVDLWVEGSSFGPERIPHCRFEQGEWWYWSDEGEEYTLNGNQIPTHFMLVPPNPIAF